MWSVLWCQGLVRVSQARGVDQKDWVLVLREREAMLWRVLWCQELVRVSRAWRGPKRLGVDFAWEGGHFVESFGVSRPCLCVAGAQGGPKRLLVGFA